MKKEVDHETVRSTYLDGSDRYSRGTAIAPWVRIGNLSGFQYNRHYSVNMVSRSGNLCAELFHLDDTSVPFNDNPAKRNVASICSRALPLAPVE